MVWATLWAIFSQTHLVTLLSISSMRQHLFSKLANLVLKSFAVPRPQLSIPLLVRGRDLSKLINKNDQKSRSELSRSPGQGCQMVYFQTKNTNMGKFWEGTAIEDVGLFYVHLSICPFGRFIMRPFGIVYGIHFPRFDMLYQEKTLVPVT
jgi:hypothetical protein